MDMDRGGHLASASGSGSGSGSGAAAGMRRHRSSSSSASSSSSPMAPTAGAARPMSYSRAAAADPSASGTSTSSSSGKPLLRRPPMPHRNSSSGATTSTSSVASAASPPSGTTSSSSSSTLTATLSQTATSLMSTLHLGSLPGAGGAGGPGGLGGSGLRGDGRLTYTYQLDFASKNLVDVVMDAPAVASPGTAAVEGAIGSTGTGAGGDLYPGGLATATTGREARLSGRATLLRPSARWPLLPSRVVPKEEQRTQVTPGPDPRLMQRMLKGRANGSSNKGKGGAPNEDSEDVEVDDASAVEDAVRNPAIAEFGTSAGSGGGGAASDDDDGGSSEDSDSKRYSGYSFPMRVRFRIALRHNAEAMQAFRRNWKLYHDMVTHGYAWSSRYVAVWETPEGLWGVMQDVDAEPLQAYWNAEVAPHVRDAERRHAIRYHKRRRLQGYFPNPPPTGSGSGGSGGSAGGDDSAMAIDGTCEANASNASAARYAISPPASSPEGAVKLSYESLKRLERDEEIRARHRSSPVSHKDPLTMKPSSAGASSTISLAQQNPGFAAALERDADGTHTTGDFKQKARSSDWMDDAIDDGVSVESGYLKAVEVFIQLAKILLGLHERRVALVVCRPEFFTVARERQKLNDTHDVTSAETGNLPTAPKNAMTSFQLQLIRLSTALQISGYDEGKVVENQQADMDGDRVLGYGIGSGGGFVPAQGKDGANEDEDDGQGALEGLYEDTAIARHLRWIAPEALSTKKAVGSIADIYSWAVCAYELLIDHPLNGIDGNHDQEFNLLEAVHTHLTKGIEPINKRMPSVPIELCQVIRKAISLDPEDRYTNMSSLLYDLEQVRQICSGRLAGEARRSFEVGAIDAQSRFKVPPGLLDRDAEFETLEQTYNDMRATQGARTVLCYGVSGSGKSKLLEIWARQKDALHGGHECLVGWAKLDQHLVKPLNGFVQVFQSLLDRVFSDPLEDSATWKARIREVLGVNDKIFCSLLSPTWRAILLDVETDANDEYGVMPDWDLYEKVLRQVVFQLLGLFASRNRPLILVIDDVQWAEPSETTMWTDLVSRTKPLQNTLLLISYRTNDEQQPELSLQPSVLIHTRSFSLPVLQEMCLKCFHLEPPRIQAHAQQWLVLSQMVYKATSANPLYVKLLLSWLVRVNVIYFDYTDTPQWVVRTGQLPLYCNVAVEDFAQATILSLSPECKRLLQILGCLPSRGIEVELLARLADLPSAYAARQRLGEATSIGIVTLRDDQVQFSHDRHHQGALDTLSTDDRARWCLELASHLDREGGDWEFLTADMLIFAREAGKFAFSDDELCSRMIGAGNKAARSAAFDLAFRYLKMADSLLPIEDPRNWQDREHLCIGIATLWSEVGRALHMAAEVIPKIRTAAELCGTPSTRINVITMLFRLKLSAFRNSLALELVPQAFAEAGIDISSAEKAFHGLPSLPTTAEEIAESTRDIDDGRPVTERDRAISALLHFITVAGPTMYADFADRGDVAFGSACALALSNPFARRNSCVVYVYVLQGIREIDMGNLELARAWYRRTDAIHYQGTSQHGSIALAHVALKYVVAKSLWDDVDYYPLYRLCSSLMDFDALTWIAALDLATVNLSSRSTKAVLRKGKEAMTMLGDDLRPIARIFITPYIQLAENMSDRSTDLSKLWRLDGAWCSFDEVDVENPHLPETFALQAAHAALQAGILFSAPRPYLDKYAERIRRNVNGGKGAIWSLTTRIVLSFYYLSGDNWQDRWPYVQECCEFLRQCHAEMAEMNAYWRALYTFRDMKLFMSDRLSFLDLVKSVEMSLQYLEKAQMNLMTGFMCLGAARAFARASQPVRLYRAYVQDGYASFERGGAYAMMRIMHAEFPGLAPEPPKSTQASAAVNASVKEEEMVGQTHRPENAPSEQASSVEQESDDTWATSKELNTFEQKLSLESILRSFLVLASERDSNTLVKRVLQILMQISRSDYACLALQSSSTDGLYLRGAGKYESITASETPLAKAGDLCPVTLLLHCATVKKPSSSDGHAVTGTLSQIMGREPFFRGKPPRSYLLLPIFVQSRFAGVLYLSARVSVNLQATQSQVGLLSTFGAIVMEAHSTTASLEEAVRLRTSQLESALAARQTFLSSVSHELRTPLHSISGLCAVMENSRDLSDAHKENLSVISNSAQDLQRIITAVLDFSKLEAGSIQPESISFDLREVVESAMDSVAHLSRAKGLELFLHNDVTTDSPAPFVSDMYRIRQCLLNLLSNAIKFTKQGSVSVRWQLEPRGFTIAVRDTGIGIAANKMSRLFHSFSQVDESTTRLHGGTGLGLSITRSLAKLMGGTTWAESEEGVGSTFFLSIGAPTGEARPGPAFPTLPRRTVRLLARDSTSTDVLRANLVRFGMDVGEHARPEVILIDVEQLGPTAADIVKLQQDNPSSNLLYLAALTDVAAVMERLDIQHASIVSKPVKAGALYDALRARSGATSESTPSAVKTKPGSSAINRHLAKECPLRILFVDDNKINVVVGCKVLAKFGYHGIDVAGDGLQALNSTEREKYDLVFLDLQMPVMDGHTALARIQASEKSGRPLCVALTANVDQVTRDTCAAEGFFGFLSKPLVMSELSNLLTQAYAHKRQAGGAVVEDVSMEDAKEDA